MGTPRGYLRPPSFMQGVLPVTLLWSASPLSLLSVCAAMAAFERINVGTDHLLRASRPVRVVVHVSWGLAVSESSERDRWIHSFANLSPALRTGRLDRRPRRSI